MSTLLFFDDWYLQSRRNLERHVGEPKQVIEGTFEDPHADVAWGYPSVIRNTATGAWQCFYQGALSGSRSRTVPLLAESEDGIRWRVPDLGARIPIPARVCPHQLFDHAGFHEWASVYADPNEGGTDRWLKALALYRGETGAGYQSKLLTSGDGLHWLKHDQIHWSSEGVDPGSFAFWNPYRRSTVITLRPSLADRRIALSETRDWQFFTPPELTVQADASDTPCALVYGMPVFRYEHMFVAFVWVFHTDPTTSERDKFLGGMLEGRRGDDMTRVMGKIDCYLGYSLNGWHFQRATRFPFLSNPSPDAAGTGCIYPSSMVDDGGMLRIYSSSSRGEHAQFRGEERPGQSALLLHTVRRDGFVYLRPPGGTGDLVTKWLFWVAGEPELNVSAPYGQVLVQMTDQDFEPIAGFRFEDCIPFSGDSTCWTPRWRDDRRVANLGNRIVHLAVRIANGRLFAIRGDFQLVTVVEANRFLHAGVRPQSRPGF